MSDREFAREQLVREMREISHAFLRTPWAEGLPFKLYAVMNGDQDGIDGKAVPIPVMAHIDALATYSKNAGGWPTGDGVETFVDLHDWEAKYDDWKAKKG